MNIIRITCCALLAVLTANAAIAAEPRVTFDRERAGRVEVKLDGNGVATYVYESEKTARPFFESVKTPSGIQVTRNNPPVEGRDAKDHADLHPGLWLAFGDIDGNDFWRNKEPRVVHERFAKEPAATNDSGSFAVVNKYVVGEKVVARETATFTFVPRTGGYLLTWESTITPEQRVSFGEQEEMGLGLRVATPIVVKGGTGTIKNSDGATNEPGVWGKAADWCDYSGTIDGKHVGVTLMPDPRNAQRTWFHARDYGVLVANPFGVRAGGKPKLDVEPDKPLTLRFAVFVHESADAKDAQIPQEYQHFVDLGKREPPLR